MKVIKEAKEIKGKIDSFLSKKENRRWRWLLESARDSFKIMILVLAIKGYFYSDEDEKRPPVEGTIVNVGLESGINLVLWFEDEKVRFDIDMDGNLDTVERTFFIKEKYFLDLAKPGDKIVYKNRKNIFAKPSKDLSYFDVKQIGDIDVKSINRLDVLTYDLVKAKDEISPR